MDLVAEYLTSGARKSLLLADRANAVRQQDESWFNCGAVRWARIQRKLTFIGFGRSSFCTKKKSNSTRWGRRQCDFTSFDVAIPLLVFALMCLITIARCSHRLSAFRSKANTNGFVERSALFAQRNLTGEKGRHNFFLLPVCHIAGFSLSVRVQRDSLSQKMFFSSLEIFFLRNHLRPNNGRLAEEVEQSFSRSHSLWWMNCNKKKTVLQREETKESKD